MPFCVYTFADEIFEARWIEIYKLGDSWNYNVEYRFTEEEREIWAETQNGNTPKNINDTKRNNKTITCKTKIRKQ